MGCGSGASEQERASISEILDGVRAHEKTLDDFRESHSGQASSIKEKAQETFHQRYTVGYLSFNVMSVERGHICSLRCKP